MDEEKLSCWPAVRIGILDNDELAGAAVSSLVPRRLPWCKVIWQTVHADAATEHCLSPGAPDILLTDVSMEGVSGLQVARDIRVVNGAIVILCMTSYTLETYAYGAAKAGAQGMCPKTPINLLCKGIEAVAQGRTWCPIENIPFESAAAAHTRLRASQDRQLTPLTDQENAIMSLILEGNSMEEVGHLLGIKSGTVRAHISHIKAKFGAKNLSQAVARWMKVNQ
jgi:DNA-binding NarL/FixJ family response regulator